ncbi:MAG: glucosyl-3-phosphoglycerate synthase [Actinomycetota bacterium]
MDVEAWFDKRTYRHQEFGNIPRLIKLKKKQKVTVSVCLPTLNSAPALDLILRVLRDILIEEYPLIDELAIIDGGSTDSTVAIAEKYGATVFYDGDGFGDLPAGGGKGDALWRSLYHLNGDIIAWLDSDIKNIHPRFVYGTVGPLLTDKSIGYVKGFYERPLTEGGMTKPSGGGRVTELVAKPLFNLYYPELSGLVQPLSGEYAGRREVLESVPFATGYGVETGLLIDIAGQFGAEAIAQVNLETRIHANQTLPALSRMAFGIMQTAFTRFERDKKVKLSKPFSTTMNKVEHHGETYSIEAKDIIVIDRPPMNTRPEYLEKRKGKKPKWPSK